VAAKVLGASDLPAQKKRRDMKMKSWKVLLIAVFAVAVIGAVVVGSVVRKTVVREVTEAMAEQLSGFDVAVETMDVSLWRGTAEMTGLKVRNPVGYPEREAFDVERIYVKYAPLSFLGKEIHLKELLVDISRVMVVRNEQGETNIERLDGSRGIDREATPVQVVRAPDTPVTRPPASSPSGPVEGAEPSEAAPGGASHRKRAEKQVRIDDLTITLGRISVRDYATGGPEPISFDHTVNEVIQMSDVTDMDEVAEEVQARLMASAFSNIGALAEQAIAQFDDLAEQVKKETGVDVSELGKLLGDALGSAEGGSSEEPSSDDVMKAVGNLFQNLTAPPAE
jgi:uncharacterized protein involved in outer membrane biogenesis